MKKLNLFVLFLPFILNAQWVQTNLNAGIGYSLFSNNSIILAGTDYGVYYTDDTGDPWFSIGPNDWIFSVIQNGNTIIAGSGSSQGIWLSSDLGQNWVQATGISNQSVYSLCNNDSFVFAGTWGGGIYRSIDNGGSWQNIALNGEAVEAIYTMNDTVIVGSMDMYGAKVGYSTDNGNTWFYAYLPYPATRVYCFEWANGSMYAGTDGGLYISNDKGNTWNLQYGVTFDSLGNVLDAKMFKSLATYNDYLIAAIMFQSIWISSNNGVDWVSFNDSLITDWTFARIAVKAPNIWALRSGFGNAYRRSLTDLISNIETNDITYASGFLMSQNYPNPFNPNTTIKYSLPKSSNVKIEVFNLLGQKITTLLNKQIPAGSHEVVFTARDLPSGVYLYRIEAGKFQEVKKMMLLK